MELTDDNPLKKKKNEKRQKMTSKNALRERSRVEQLRKAYLDLQNVIPSVPPNTKLSKV